MYTEQVSQWAPYKSSGLWQTWFKQNKIHPTTTGKQRNQENLQLKLNNLVHDLQLTKF